MKLVFTLLLFCSSLSWQIVAQLIPVDNRGDFYFMAGGAKKDSCKKYKFINIHKSENKGIYIEFRRDSCIDFSTNGKISFIKIDEANNQLSYADNIPSRQTNPIDLRTGIICSSEPDEDWTDTHELEIKGKNDCSYIFRSIDDRTARFEDSLNATFVVEKLDNKTKKLIWKTKELKIDKDDMQDGQLNSIEHFYVTMDKDENSYVVFRGNYYGRFNKKETNIEGITKADYFLSRERKGLTVVKYNAKGKLLWNKAFLDFELWEDYGTDAFCMSLDDAGNYFIAGTYFDSHNNIDIAFDDIGNIGGLRHFLVKINSKGQAFLSFENARELKKMIADEKGGLWVLYNAENYVTYIKKVNFMPIKN